MKELVWVLGIYLLLINLYSFVIMGLDKRRARTNAWRVPEKKLFILAIIGGAIGIYSGMKYFRHKTKHWLFVYLIPVLIIANLLIIIFITTKLA